MKSDKNYQNPHLDVTKGAKVFWKLNKKCTTPDGRLRPVFIKHKNDPCLWSIALDVGKKDRSFVF